MKIEKCNCCNTTEKNIQNRTEDSSLFKVGLQSVFPTENEIQILIDELDEELDLIIDQHNEVQFVHGQLRNRYVNSVDHPIVSNRIKWAAAGKGLTLRKVDYDLIRYDLKALAYERGTCLKV